MVTQQRRRGADDEITVSSTICCNVNTEDLLGLDDVDLTKETSSSCEKGEIQPNKCRDIPFAILFIANLLFAISLAILKGHKAYIHAMELVTTPIFYYDDEVEDIPHIGDDDKWEENFLGDDDDDVASFRHLRELSNKSDLMMEKVRSDVILASLWFPIFTSAMAGFLFTGIAMKSLISFPEKTIKTSLLLNVVLLIFAGIYATVRYLFKFNDSSLFVALKYFFFAIVLAWYAKVIWHMIPNATSCLKVGMIACERSKGIFISSLLGSWFFVIILAVQIIASVVLLDIGGAFDSNNSSIGIFVVVMAWLLFSIYWTSQVVMNISSVTVCGSVGKWWSTSHHDVADSLKRSVTFSFGSICLGSLFTSIIQGTVDNLRSVKRHSKLRIFFCITTCLLRCLEIVFKYFNKWAYVYVGLYGYKYMDAGKKVMSLLKSRGWTSIISHNVLGQCLSLMMFSIGLITLLVDTILIEMILNSSKDYKNIYSRVGGTLGQLTGPLIAFVCGLSISAATMNVVSSAVDTVVVCFAEAPDEFDENHPELSGAMNDAFALAWPEFDLALDATEKDPRKGLKTAVV